MLGGIYEIQILSGFYYRQAYYDRSGWYTQFITGITQVIIEGLGSCISPIQNLTADGETLIMNYRLAFWVCFLGSVACMISVVESGMYISGHRCHRADFLRSTDVVGFDLEELLFGGINSCKTSERAIF
jgi:hypothetical protein